MSLAQVQRENAELRLQLAEAEEALRAIRQGEVDAIIVEGECGQQIFSLNGADTIYRLTVETMAEAAINVAPDGRILFCNARFSHFAGAPAEQLLGRNLAEFVPPEERENLRAMLAQCARQPVKQRVLFCAPGDVQTPAHLSGVALTQDGGLSLCLVASDLTELETSTQIIQQLHDQQHQLEQARRAALNVVRDANAARARSELAEAALRESEERLRLLGDNLPDSAVYQYVVERDGTARFVYFSAGIERLIGITAADALNDSGALFRQILPEHRKLLDEATARSQRDLSDFDLELPMRRNDGTVRWMQLHSRPRRLPNGGTLWEGVQTDITERKRVEDAIKSALAEKEVLLREVHHRVKNNMQVLSSLVSLQSQALANDERESQEANLEGESGSDGPTTIHASGSTLRLRNAFDDLRDRVRSMALIHENLYQSGNFAAVDLAIYAKTLLNNLWHAHRCETPIRLELALEPVAVPLDQAVPCGLLLNELAINALKHAFRGRSGGTVTVAARTLDDGQVSLRVADDGVGLPEGLIWQQASSLGLRLVRMLSQQLRGSLDVRCPEGGGTEFEVTFAVPR